MRIDFEQFIKEQLIPLIVVAIGAVVLLAGSIYSIYSLSINADNYNKKTQKYESLKSEKANLEKKLQEQKKEEQNPKNKKIFNVDGLKFGVDASFAPLFDNMLNVAKNSGIRIRTVNYNYTPEKDPIFAAKLNGYNVCELDMTIVGKYSQIQTFLKTMLSEQYLINFAQIDIVSWKRDKSILIANLKLRFYTKTK